MKKNIAVLSLTLLSLSFIPSHSFAKEKENQTQKISASYKKKAETLYDLSFSGDSYYGDNYRKYAAKAFLEKGYSEAELDQLITTYQNPLAIRFIKDNNRYFYSDIASKEESKQQKTEKKHKPVAKDDYEKREKEYREKRCKEQLPTEVESIISGINRTKNICSGIYPAKLDNADDGKYNREENRLFSYVKNSNSYSYSDFQNWSKLGNSYSYKCENTQQKFTYNPQDGSFK